MKLALSVLAVGTLAAAWLALPEKQEPATASATPATATAPGPARAPAPQAGMAFFAPVASAPAPAATSLAATRQHGDPQAPPMAREPVARTPPTAQELADPKAYEAYEAREAQRTYAAYIHAVDEELPRLRANIARGRAMGIGADKIAMAEDKARRLAMMRTQLVQELAAAHSPLTTGKEVR